MFRFLFIFALAVCAVAQPPLIYNRSILNSASFMPQSLPGGAIAQGSVFTLFGARLGPSKPVTVSSFPLGTTLGGVSITATQGSTTVNAIPLYISASQINAILPSNTPIGLVSIRVTYNSVQSNPMRLNVSPTALGIFTATGSGLGPGILQNFLSASNQPINSPTVAAKPGQAITLWGTGLGPVPADNVAPTAGNLATKVEVFVGGVTANILYSGRTPCCAGVDQVVFEVPANAPQGCWVPVTVRTAGATVSNFVTMAITPTGGSCFGSGPAPPFVNAGKYGAVLALRAATHEDIGPRAPIDVTGDYAAAIAYQVPSSNFPFHPVFSYPPAGTCTVYTVKGDLLRGDTLPGAVPGGGTPLNFGSALTLAGPLGSKALQSLLSMLPLRYLGGSVTGNFFTDTLFLQPGNYQVVGTSGGSAVGGFSVSTTMPQVLNWTNRDQLVAINRAQPLSVAWAPVPANQQVAVIGFGVDLPTDSSTVFGCPVPPGATSFSVPAVILSNLPPSRANPLQSKSVIYLVTSPASSAAKLNASGLDFGFAAFGYAAAKTVVFQ